MPTNPIGRGTCNLSINVQAPARLALGRLAFAKGQAMGELVRELIADRLELALKRREISAGAALEALEALGRAGRNGLMVALLGACLFSAMPRPSSRRGGGARRPAACLRLTARPHRKLGEWEVPA